MVNGQGLETRAFASILLCMTALCLWACGNSGDTTATAPSTTTKPDDAPTVELTLKDQTFDLELALDDVSRNQGLSDRKSIDDGGGMLFVFPYARSTQFVMRRCYVPIDLIFIDNNGYIDSLHAMEVIEPIGGTRWNNPFTGYPSAGRILYAVELKGGKIEELGLARGEKIELPEAVLQLKAQ